jgi:pectinesterase
MANKTEKFCLLLLLSFSWIATSLAWQSSCENGDLRIVVANDGTGNFRSINEAIESLPMFNYERVIIFIKNGVYHEKVAITQDNVTLQGQSEDSTIIQYSQLRSDWVAHKDTIGPAVVNIFADDVILRDLTVRNTQPLVGPHAFAIYGTGTRTILVNCKVASKGGDTVSMWDYKNGMYYYDNCDFSGAVDFVCPRGWCYAKDCKFYELKEVPSIWHAGGYNVSQKFVILRSKFDGVKSFELGRHHYEAQFYLVDCTFSRNMADVPIYRVTYGDSTKDRPFNWGERDYYYNCHREGGDYSWFRNNLSTAVGSPVPSEMTPSWTFEGKWNPEDSSKLKAVNYSIRENNVLFFFSEPMTVFGNPRLISNDGIVLTYISGSGSNTLRFNSDKRLTENDLVGLKEDGVGRIFGTIASVYLRPADFNIVGESK